MPDNWGDVEAQAAKVEKVNPGQIQGVAQQFRKASENTGDHSTSLKNAAAPLQEGGVWNGDAADAFFDYVGKVAAAGARVKSKLDEAAEELSSLQQQLSEIKNKINETKKSAEKTINERNEKAEQEAQEAERTVQAAHGDGGSGGGRDPEAIREQARQANRQTASQATERIKSLMNQANQAIKKAQRLMKQEIDGGGYSQVPVPGGAQSQMASTGGISGGGSAPSVGGSSGGSGGGGGDVAAAAGGGGLGSSGGPPAGPPPGNVEQWIKEAIKILQQNGIPVTEENIDQIWTIIEHESGGDPRAINDWDSNAAKGTPSKGLMQCIDPTFDAHAVPGHTDIWNPVDNIVAGVRYTFDRYGSLDQHPGLASIASGGGYQPY